MTGDLLYDVHAESALIGAALIYRQAAEVMVAGLTAGDFGSPSIAAQFDAVAQLLARGDAVDPHSVVDQLQRSGTASDDDYARLTAAVADAPGPASAPQYVEMLARWSLRRRLAARGAELISWARDPMRDPGEALDAHRAQLAEIDSPVLARSPGDIELANLLDEPDEASEVLVQDLLGKGWRVILVGPEGKGKSQLLWQMAVMLAFGLHPFLMSAIAAQAVLLVDLENPRRLVRQRLRYLTELAGRHSQERAPLTYWGRPEGIDLRRRSDRVQLEDVLRRHRPALVVLGPIYKAYRRSANESDEQVAAEVQAVLDDLRSRFGFCLLAEHHAPQSQGGYRDLRPFGSSLWLRWPELGIKLTPDAQRSNDVLVVGRWRGDRTQVHWPDELHRGQVLPWEGKWTQSQSANRTGDGGDD